MNDAANVAEELDARLQQGFDLWQDAATAAALLLVDPDGLKGARILASAGPVRDAWLKHLSDASPDDGVVSLPSNIDEDRLLGGVDLDRSLRDGVLHVRQGLLSEADGGLLVARMADRMSLETATALAGALDTGEVVVERTGASRKDPARFTLILLDEADADEPGAPAALCDRVAFTIALDDILARLSSSFDVETPEIHAARKRLQKVRLTDAQLNAILTACAKLGVSGLRAPLFCLRASRALAALDDRDEVLDADIATACRLTLSGRSQMLAPQDPQAQEPPPPTDDGQTDDAEDTQQQQDLNLEDIAVEAVRSAAVSKHLAALAMDKQRRKSGLGGKSGAFVQSLTKGRPAKPQAIGNRRTGRIDLVQTLKAAAPWSKLRGAPASGARLALRPSDIRVKRFRQRTESCVIFAVDASGSNALNRMAEAKGAVEMLLSDCYARRDHVALIAFRGDSAEVLLPPTRSLVRVRRSLSGLPGGGATPLASAVAKAADIAVLERQRGRDPFVVILSDGRGNIDFSGHADRSQADADATKAAHRLRALGAPVLFFDTSRRPSDRARAFSADLDAAYVPLPTADARRVSNVVRDVVGRR